MNHNCYNCKHDGEREYCGDCVIRHVGSTHEPDKWENDGSYTNADRIRNMSNEELAEFLAGSGLGAAWSGADGALRWLQEPAEE